MTSSYRRTVGDVRGRKGDSALAPRRSGSERIFPFRFTRLPPLALSEARRLICIPPPPTFWLLYCLSAARGPLPNAGRRPTGRMAEVRKETWKMKRPRRVIRARCRAGRRGSRRSSYTESSAFSLLAGPSAFSSADGRPAGDFWRRATRKLARCLGWRAAANLHEKGTYSERSRISGCRGASSASDAPQQNARRRRRRNGVRSRFL